MKRITLFGCPTPTVKIFALHAMAFWADLAEALVGALTLGTVYIDFGRFSGLSLRVKMTEEQMKWAERQREKENVE